MRSQCCNSKDMFAIRDCISLLTVWPVNPWLLLLDVGGIPEAEGAAEEGPDEVETDVEGVSRALDRKAIAPS